MANSAKCMAYTLIPFTFTLLDKALDLTLVVNNIYPAPQKAP